MTFHSIILQVPVTRAAWEYVYALYSYLGVACGAVTFVIVLYFCVRYRSKIETSLSPLDPRTRENRDSKWKGVALIYLLMAVVLIAVGSQSIGTYNVMSSVPNSPNTLRINVIAHQFSWTFVYPDGFTSEDLAVVPTNTIVVFNVTSRDVYHQFGIPYFRVKTDAIPGRVNQVWIETTDAGNFTVQCFELCGVGHATMIGTLSIVDPATFSQWYAATSPGGT